MSRPVTATHGRTVLVVHVPYQQRGGEDVHVEALCRAYRRIGLEPVTLAAASPARPAALEALQSLLPIAQAPSVEQAWRAARPAFIHLHNAFPRFGPRLFRWAAARGLPLVMTIHNHRLFCTNGLALRQGQVCEDCLGDKLAWRPVLHNCNGDWKKTLYHSLALTQMRQGALYACAVTRFVAPSPYVRELLVRLGIAPERLTCLVHPIEGPAPGAAAPTPAYDFVYAGRLSAEKGIGGLLEAARLRPTRRLAIAGDGPERPQVERAAHQLPQLSYLGPLSHPRVLELICASRAAVLPSVCKETVSLLALEAVFQGKPCVLPAGESTAWLAADSRFPIHLARNPGGAGLAEALDRAWAAAPLALPKVAELQDLLGFDRFCRELEALVTGLGIEGLV